ncbi:ATP-grasp domain-containing protein [Corynebacterium lizhenjunii]|uniref:ATP-grasp domain-containing protein n=1 Tax=Corynebacterium lizhenjunii TaxID=2709394 RepID=UPI0013EC4E99|nr:ATP-grasp domain-containing protein [Corynebacterium lizhenjunii]
MKNILLIESMAAGNALVAQRAAERGYRLRIATADRSLYPDAEGVEFVDIDTSDYRVLQAYVSKNRDDLAAIASPTDGWGVTAAQLRDEFGFASRFSASELSRFRDKEWVRKQLDLFGKHGDTSVEAADGARRFPLIAKPRRGTGSQDIRIISTAEELAEFRQSHSATPDQEGQWVIEPYHQGPLYSAECYTDGKSYYFFGITNRIMSQPPEFVEVVKTFPHAHGTPWEDSAREWTHSVLETIGYNAGFAHVEFIQTREGFELVELNARMAGALITPAVTACTNYDPYAMVIDEALGADVEVPGHRQVRGGHSHVSLYANRLGKLKRVEGAEGLNAFPGQPTWHPAKTLGSQIEQLGTYRARIGNVSAVAPTPELAQDRAIVAAQSLSVVIE